MKYHEHVVNCDLQERPLGEDQPHLAPSHMRPPRQQMLKLAPHFTYVHVRVCVCLSVCIVSVCA